jgi:hypothetical protein
MGGRIMRDLRRIQEIVEQCLRNCKETRSSDRYLYYIVLNELDPSLLGHSVRTFLIDDIELGYPKFDSISRIRRKLQAKYPELRAVEVVEDMRNKRKDEFEKYAKEL